jgi:CDP-diacylglycerol pyrophosphatase
MHTGGSRCCGDAGTGRDLDSSRFPVHLRKDGDGGNAHVPQMSKDLSHVAERETSIKRTAGLNFGRKPAVVASICACAAFFLLAADAAQEGLSRSALWEVVRSVCVPGQAQNRDPSPCLQVDLSGGVEEGFAILKDPRVATHFLLIPTTQISGIESSTVLLPSAPNYFAKAWDARMCVSEALQRTLPADDIGLAVNSAASRSQDQLHIHIDCVRADVFDALHKNEEQIGSNWAAFKHSLAGHQYLAMWVPGENLGSTNPFRLLAERSPDGARSMGNYTLAVIGLTRADGTRGFVILADQVNKGNGDLGTGEELLDHSCSIATIDGQVHGP